MVGEERKKETLDGFFQQHLSIFQRGKIQVACIDMWKPFRLSIEENAPGCAIVYDKFHILQHANRAIDEVRRAEFFRQGKQMRDLVKGKRWLLLSRWRNLDEEKRQTFDSLFLINKRLSKAHLLKESLDQLWLYRYEGAMLKCLQGWLGQLRWDPESLQSSTSNGCSRSNQWQYQNTDQTRQRLQKTKLSPAQGTANCLYQHPIPYFSESRINTLFRRIPAQSLIMYNHYIYHFPMPNSLPD
jgi:transposase